MTTIDVALVTRLVSEVGASLLAAYPANRPPADREGILATFKAINDPTADRLKHDLALAYPDIPWTDDEFDLEGDKKAPAGDVWICDPIDGAVQFLNHLPAWCISLALVREGVPILSVLHDPTHGELFHAVAGGGAFLNGEPLRPSAKQQLKDALAATSHPPFLGDDQVSIRRAGESLSAVLGRVAAVRNLGPTSLQLAYVAAGRLDAFWEFGDDRTNWLAGSLMLREAGAALTDARGEAFGWESKSIAAAAPGLHGALIEALAPVV
jgi:myo-inositol-1(or 4)-monophosphatase